MNRRDFAIGMMLTPLAGTLVHAATEVIEGKDYLPLQKSVPVAMPGKLEVIEFFGYWCPHCYAFEAKLEAWVKTLPADVNFRRIPVAWQDMHVPYQKLFYGLESMGVKSDVHAKVFRAVHDQHLRLDSDANLAAFAAAIGVDNVKLLEAVKSFSVATKIRAVSQQLASYQIEGVPTLVINGKYATSPETAKGEDQALQVVDALLQKARSKR
jgi:thiol:disulfide interchange protein DsbA